MEALIKSAKLSINVLSDKNLPQWKKIHEALAAYAETNLTLLPMDIRNEFEKSLLKINNIFSTYEISKTEDYAKMKHDDLNSVTRILKNFSLRVLSYEKQ
jgi:hypothetical protein